MKIKNIKFSKQLSIGFSAMMFFVLSLAYVANNQSDQIQAQLEDLYNHPLIVRRAIGFFRADFISIQRDVKDMLIRSDEAVYHTNANQIEHAKTDAFDQITIL